MTPKQELLKEIETAPAPLIAEVLDFLQFLKTKHLPVDGIKFAGMTADTPELMGKMAHCHTREDELEAIADELADTLHHHKSATLSLSDYAISREGIYEAHP